MRLHDNPVLDWTNTQFNKAKVYFSDLEIVPVYVFDPKFYTERSDKYDTRRAGILRTKFHI